MHLRANAIAKPPMTSRDDSESSLQALRNEMDEFRKLSLQNRSVTIPILGIHIDGNDLGLIASVVFSVLLYLSASCLRREQINLHVAKVKAESLKLLGNMELLLMAQVLSPGIIPTASQPASSRRTYIQKLLANLPVWATLGLPILFVIYMTGRDLLDWPIAYI